MEIIETPDEMRAWSRSKQKIGETCGFVPTMGALHDGHAALIKSAAAECDRVVVSIFVNSLQFNDSKDFEKYPRTFSADTALCESLSVDVVYAPTSAAMYPPRFQTSVVPGSISAPLEGAGRPGHFTGVATVVAKLFNAVEPTHAYFGTKDFQQLAVISQMVRDLDMGVNIVPVSTVRDSDGLALSSRNVRLTPDDRRAAPIVYRSLQAGAELCRSGERSPAAIIDHVTKYLASELRARIEYVDVIDSATCEPVPSVGDKSTLVAAVWFGDVRLIDNISLPT